MTLRSWKRFLVGAAVAGASLPSLALAAPTCAYVIAQVNSVTVTTPAVVVAVPDSDALVQPVRVHLDDQEQTILGYSVRVPGFTYETDGSPVFVPGVSQYIPSISTTVPQINLTPNRCMNLDGVSTPAVPVYIPASILTVPGAVADVGGIILNIVGHPVTAPGQVITFDGKTIVIPAQSAAVPSVPVGTPDATIIVDVNGVVQQAHYLAPPAH